MFFFHFRKPEKRHSQHPATLENLLKTTLGRALGALNLKMKNQSGLMISSKNIHQEHPQALKSIHQELLPWRKNIHPKKLVRSSILFDEL